MTEEVENAVADAMAQYQHRDQWRLWGLHEIREQGNAILLTGAPGCGKTSIAYWMADKLKKGLRELTVSQIGGGNPGESERKVHDLFEDARFRNNMTIVMDECDVLLMDRSKIKGEGQTWMIGTTEAIMMELNTYKGLVICATNHSVLLDPALAERFMAVIEVKRPDSEGRLRLWKMKWPNKFPLQLKESDFRTLADTYDLDGRQIETVIIRTGSMAIRKQVKPNLKMLLATALEETKKHIQ